MHLTEVEHHHPQSAWGHALDAMKAAGIPIPKILALFNYKPQATVHLARFTQEVMRGPSPLLPGERELIAAFTSRVNNCDF
ncbi:MAG TPA: peroxidase [Thermoanaerobaculia bacterium]|nr:peroxidase [Thermoanaerobaculia bacterium]